MQELKTHQENKVSVSKSEFSTIPSLNHTNHVANIPPLSHTNYVANIPPTTELLVKLENHKVPTAADD